MIITKQMTAAKPVEQKDKWETPLNLFKEWNEKYGFTLDPCCEIHTAKAANYFTEETNGLDKDWSGHVVYVNPPYSRGNIDKWLEKCFNEAKKGTKIVVLIPVSSSARWFHKYVWGHCELHFIKGRLKFEGAPCNAPFSSALAIYN